MSNITHAIVLAAGLGTRLRPLTLATPKPLVKVGGKCLLDWALDQVASAGIEHAVVNTSYLYEQVERHIEMRRSTPVVRVSREQPVPLETGGGIAKALPMLGDKPFIVLNSDTICVDTHGDTAIARLNAYWNTRTDIDFLMLLHPREKAIGFYNGGDFCLCDDGSVRRPEAGEEAPYVFTGIEIIHPRAFNDCPEGPFSLNLLWNNHRRADGCFARVAAIVHTGDWLHVGDVQGLKDVEAYFSRNA